MCVLIVLGVPDPALTSALHGVLLEGGARVEDSDLVRLADLLAPRVAAALAQLMGTAAPLRTKTELAAHFAVKEAQIDRFVRKGMPEEYVGASPRYRLAACEEWVRKHARRRKKKVTTSPSEPGTGLPLGATTSPPARDMGLPLGATTSPPVSGTGLPPGVTPIGRAGRR
jgi:hypothetical protein